MSPIITFWNIDTDWAPSYHIMFICSCCKIRLTQFWVDACSSFWLSFLIYCCIVLMSSREKSVSSPLDTMPINKNLESSYGHCTNSACPYATCWSFPNAKMVANIWLQVSLEPHENPWIPSKWKLCKKRVSQCNHVMIVGTMKLSVFDHDKIGTHWSLNGHVF